MSTRYFTPDEANATLAEVRPLAERLVEHRRALAEAMRRRADIGMAIAGNGGGLQPSELADLENRSEEEATAVAACVEAIQARGALVKDLDRGLVDFPSHHGEEEILLCWHAGEEEIGFWHGTEEGFAGRKPLDELH